VYSAWRFRASSRRLVARHLPQLNRREPIVQETTDQSLYQRLGGYDAIAAATDELLARLQADPQLGDYWKGASSDNRRKARQLIVDFMSEAAGGPTFYNGRSMELSHAGMHISESDWEVFMHHSAATLAHFDVPDREANDVLAFFTSLRDDIVER
jgi:hemoglobin